ncbi:hypothetical protein C1645_815389 [Glomus cerebriforme]|uniref:Crinkler effector protein N-terminal domain-containing protein n=1 Tax=Glomus cerebriforme TaxID=658196 RepID=A0A397TEL4_9GLOM|nr:hypothetical protein C1645_815389 [Glomus cerebriforme]
MSNKIKESDKSKIPDKLEKFLERKDITLNYLISDEKAIFDVMLVLYKVGFMANSVIKLTLKNNNIIIVEGSVEMGLQDIIFSHFSDQPKRIFFDEKEINVIMYPLTETVLETVGHLKDAIKEKNTQAFANINVKDIKLWKVNIFLKELNEKLNHINEKINVNIKTNLKHPVKMREVHYTATFEDKTSYLFHFFGWNWDEHIINNHESDSEKKHSTVHLVNDEDLIYIIWSQKFKIDLPIIMNTYDYNKLPTFVGGVKEMLEEIQNLVIGEFLRLYKTFQHITRANEATIFEAENAKLKVIKQHNAKLETKNAKLELWRQYITLHEKKSAKLKVKSGDFIIEYFDLKNKIVKLKTSIEEQERKNIELESRLTIMEQDSSIISGENGVVLEVVTVLINSAKCLNGKLLEKKEVDTFLDEVHKKSVDNEIRLRNKKKKLKKTEQASSNQNQESADGIKNSVQSRNKAISCDMISTGTLCQNSSTVPLLSSGGILSLAQLFDKATDAEYVTIHAN